MKRLLLSSALILLAGATHFLAQGNSNNIFISAPANINPSSISTCQGVDTFRFKALNINIGTLTGVEATYSLPIGVNYSSSFTSTAGFTVTEIDVTDPQNPVLGISDIAVGENPLIEIVVTSDCGVVGQVTLSNNIRVDVSNNAFYDELTVPSYIPNNPSIITTVDIGLVNAKFGNSYSRTFKLEQSGNGFLTEVLFERTVGSSYEIDSLILNGFGDMPFTVISGTGGIDTIRLTLTNAMLIAAGITDGTFDQNDTVKIKEVLTVKNCAGNNGGQGVGYWGCGGDVCEKVNPTSVGILFGGFAPDLKFHYYRGDDLNFFPSGKRFVPAYNCGMPFNRAVLVENIGNERAVNISFDIQLIDPQVNVLVDSGFRWRNGKNGAVMKFDSVALLEVYNYSPEVSNLMFGGPTPRTFRVFMNTTDIEVGDSIYVQWAEVSYANDWETVPGISCTGGAAGYLIGRTRFWNMTYSDPCLKININEGFQGDQAYHRNRFSVGKGESPTGVFAGTPATTEFTASSAYLAGYQSISGSSGAMAPEGYIDYKFTLPDGLDYAGDTSDLTDPAFALISSNGTVKWYPSKIFYNDTVFIARYYIATNPSPSGFSFTTNTKLNFSYEVDCSELPACPAGNPTSSIKKEIYAVLDPVNCASKFYLDCVDETDPMIIFCNFCDPCPVGIRYVSTDVERSSFGFPDKDNDGRADLDGMGNPLPKDSLKTDSLVKNKYLLGDSITASYLGFNNTTAGNPFPYDTVPFMEYCFGEFTVPFSEFEAGSGVVKIYDASTSTWHTGTSPKVFKQGNTAYLDASVDTLLAYTTMTPVLPIGFVYEQGDSVYMEIKIGVTRVVGRTKINNTFQMRIWDSDSVLPANTYPTEERRFSCIPPGINLRRLTQYGFDDFKIYSQTWRASGCTPRRVSDYYWIYMYEDWLDQFPNEYRHLFDITNWESQVPPGGTLTDLDFVYYRQNPNGSYSSYSYTNQPFEYFAGGDSVRMLNVLDTLIHGPAGDMRSDGSVLMYVYPTWQLSCESEDNVQINIGTTFGGDWDTTQFGDIPISVLGSTGETPFVQSYYPNNSFRRVIYDAPKLSVNVGLPVVDAVQKNTYWTVNFANNAPNDAHAYNTWFYFDNALSGNQIHIDSVVEVGTDSLYVANANGFYELGNLNSLQTRQFKIYSSYTNCELEYIELYSGYNCPSYFTDINDVRLSGGSCEAEIDTMGIQPLNVLWQASNTIGLDSSHLCDPNRLEYQFTNVQVGHSYSTTVRVVTPLNSFLDMTTMEIEYPSGGTTYPVPSSAVQFIAPNEYLIFLDSVVPGLVDDGISGPLTSGQNHFKFRFDFELACGYVSGSQINTSVFGKRSCGANTNVAGAPPQTVFVYGVPEPYFINPRISSNDTVNICNDDITVRINNLKLGSNGIGPNDTIRVTLPSGLSYVPGSVVFLKNPLTHSIPTISHIGSLTLLEWNLPTPVAELDSIDFTIDISADSTVGCGFTNIQVQTVSDASGFCVSTGTSCGVKAQTGFREKGLEINKPNLEFIEASATSVFENSMNEEVTVYVSYLNLNSEKTSSYSYSIYSDVNSNSVYDMGIDTFVFNSGTINKVISNTDTVSDTLTFIVPNLNACPLLIEFDSSSCMCSYDLIPISEVRLFNAGLDTIVCSNSSGQIGGDNSIGHSYLWSGLMAGSSLDDYTVSNPIYTATNVTTTTVDEIYLTTTRSGGCVSVDTVLITMPVWELDTSSFTPVSICNGITSLGSITVKASNGIGTAPVYSLTGSYTAVNNTGYFPNLPEGIYTVEVSSGYCPLNVLVDLWLPKIECDTMYRGIPSAGGTDKTCLTTINTPGTGPYSIGTCDGSGESSSGITLSLMDSCVTYTTTVSPFKGDTACIIICDTIFLTDVSIYSIICDTTIIVYYPIPEPDTIVTVLSKGIPPVVVCADTTQHIGNSFDYDPCGGPTYGVLNKGLENCYTYIPLINDIDTACVIVCDEFDVCDTTVFIFIPPVTPDTVITTDTVTCVDTTEMPGGTHDTITGCDGNSPTTNVGGGVVTIDPVTGCVTTSPNFGSGLTDTTCIIVCKTIAGVEICDTTIIVIVKPPTPDTIVIPTGGNPVDTCLTQDELAGGTFDYINCGNPSFGVLNENDDTCFTYVPIINKLDTVCIVICDENNICDTTVLIYVPPVTPDTVITTDTVTCVDTTEMPDGSHDLITGCDGMSPTTSTGGGVVTIDPSTGCVTTSPDFGSGNTDTTCIIVCDTLLGVCDTTIIVIVKPPTPDTITQFTNGMTTDSCITTEELVGTTFTYINCGSPNHGTMSNVDSCYKYVPSTNKLDTTCTIICDEFGICDTTIFIYIPPVTSDTVITTDTVVCIDTTGIPGGVDTIKGCDGNSPTTTTGGGVVTIDPITGCVTTSPDFGSGLTDTTCIIVCKTIAGVETCDTTIIITVKPPTPDTITQFTNGMTTDSCITTDELLGTNLTYINCDSPNYGTMSNVDSCYKYVPITNKLDTACTIICDEYGICDTTVFIYIPPVTPDTVITTDTIVCVDTTEIPGGVGTITGCDGMSPTSSAGGGLVTIDANGCVTTSPDFTNGNTDTTCIIVCNTIMGVEICDTTIIITVKPPTPDTITQLTHGMTTDTCLSTSELIGTNYTYVNCGNPVYGVLANNNDSCFTYTPITNELDTSCVIICDEYGICDTTVFIYIPPVTPDTVITTDTIVCVDTTEIPGGVGTITGCDGMSPTSSAGGGLVTIDANGCVTTSPDFTNGNTDTTCIIVCNTIMGVEICDTTIIITVKPPTPDTITQFTNGMTTDSCITTEELLGTNLTYINCGSPSYGTMSNVGSCYKYVPITNKLDTSCTIICDEYGICDTTVFIYIPPVTPDTVITTDTVVCVDTTEIPGGVGTITGCDGMSPTTSAGGGVATIDANGCVSLSPMFGSGNTDTTCIIVCNTIMGVEICDTTIIITVKPPTPDTIIQLTNGLTTDTCLSTSELIGTNYTYVNCGNPVYGVLANNNDSCFTYTPITNELDTSCVIICDEFGICDTTVFIYIPPVTPDTVITTDTVVCVDTTEIPGGVGTITGCDGMSPTTSAGGGVATIDANGCVSLSPMFGSGNTDTTCIIVCNTIMGVEICDTTIIITVKPPTPDTITQFTNGMTTDSCITTEELLGTNLTYINCGSPSYGTMSNVGSCYKYVPITNKLDTSCTIICDEYGICDTTVFIYIPPVTPDTVITTDTIVCVDTTEIPGGVGTITGCDGMSPTSSAGGGLVTIDANGCVTTSPDFTNGNTDTTCIIVCNTIMGVEICDTTIIITVKPPTPDTIIQITDGKPTDTCLSTSELIGTNYTYVNCGNPVYGVLANNNDSCFTYTPITNELDTSCVIICDEYGICDTTVFIYVPPVTPDTIYTQDSVVCVDTTEMSAGYHTATGCDGMNPTTTSNGGAVIVDAKGCATIDPIFGSGVTDTTCIIICDTIFGICDTTIIINKRMSLPDTIYECIPRDGEANDSNMNTNDLLGSIVRTSTIQLPNHGQFTLTDDTNSSYQTSPFPRLDTVTVKIFDKYGCYDMFTFIYIPPMHPDTIKRQGGGIVSVDTTEMPDDRYTSIGTCDGMNMTSNGGTVVPMSGGRVLITPDYTTSNVDTTCVVLCDSVLPMCECDTTYIISFKPTIPDTFAILLPKGTNTADTCLSTSELFGKTYSYRRLGAPTPHGPVTTHNDTCINYVQTSTTKYLDTARVLICDECGNCDTTVIVYVPTPDPDTLFLGPVIPLSNADTCVSLESSYMTGMHIGTCDGTGTTSSGVPVAIAGLCVRYPVPPAVFTGDTTCIVVCDTILNITICDTTLIIYLPDTTPPTVICRDDTVYLDATGNVTIDTSNVAGTVYDNTLINSVWVTPTMFNCSHVGANSVMLYARDTNRNMDSCSATITVLDTIAPTAMCQNVTIVLDSMGNASITALTVDAGSFDNCAIASLTVSQTSFDCSHVGVNTVTLTVIDVNGNVSTCTSTVTVEDRIAPIVYCPADKQVILRNTMCTYIVEDFRDEVNLWDNCSTDDIRVTQSPDPGTSVPLDNTSMTVTITATDGSGNASTCTFEVEARCSKDLNIPQFISPTGSGQNDTWEIPELANYPNNTVKVFNRWGNLVFEQKGYYTGWDGSSNVDRGANMLLGENMLPEGTYFYIIDLGEGSGIEPYVGYMQIKR